MLLKNDSNYQAWLAEKKGVSKPRTDSKALAYMGLFLIIACVIGVFFLLKILFSDAVILPYVLSLGGGYAIIRKYRKLTGV